MQVVKNFLILQLCFFVFACDSHQVPALTVFDGQTMGTTYLIKIVVPLSADEKATMQGEIQSLFDSVNGKMSTYLAESEISRFNQYRQTDWYRVTHETAVVVHHAQIVSEKTQGAFDITVGPLVNLWGFGPKKNRRVPSAEEIAQVKKRIGYRKLTVDLNENLLKKENHDIYLDLSAIAKGYAVDVVCDYLTAQHIDNYMVEIGGEIRVKGKKHGQGWKIAIESPSENTTGKIHAVALLTDKAIATSGDYRNFRYVPGGTRISHTIDPQTGKPIIHNLASVTVVDKTCINADAMATALMVLGEVKGIELARKLKLCCYFIIRTKDGFQVKTTAGFNDLLSQ